MRPSMRSSPASREWRHCSRGMTSRATWRDAGVGRRRATSACEFPRMIDTAVDIQRGLSAAAGWLLRQRSPNGLWSDFRTEAGQSEEWVSGFAAYALLQTGQVDREIT